MKRVVISGYYGFNNLGDEAVLEGIIGSFRRMGRGVELIVLSARPRLTQRIYKVRAINRANPVGLLYWLWGADLLISGGGSLLQDVTSKRSIFYYLAIIGLGRILCKHVMVYGQGIGPINAWVSRVLVRVIVNGVDLITVRDAGSKDKLLALGIKRPPIHITSDPSFIIKPVGLQKSPNYLMKNKPIVGIAIRLWRNVGSLKQAVGDLCDHLANELKAAIIFIPMQYPWDKILAEEIAKEINIKSRPLVLSGIQRPTELMSLIGSMDLIIGMRLHALIFASLMGVPFVAISYDPKVDEFSDSMGVKPVVNIEDIAVNLWPQVEQVWRQKEQIKAAMVAKIAVFKQRAWENTKYALSLIENG